MIGFTLLAVLIGDYSLASWKDAVRLFLYPTNYIFLVWLMISYIAFYILAWLSKKYDKTIVKNTLNMAWPAIIESFFVAFAGLVDSYMVSALGASAVAAVGLTTQPKFMGFALFFALNVAVSALVARRRGENRQKEANRGGG